MKTMIKVLAAILALTMLMSASAFAEDMDNTTEQAVVETAAPEAPKAEEPKAEEPKTEEPKAEEPKAEEPKAEEPKAEEPKAEEPKAEVPAAEPEAPVTENTETAKETTEEVAEEATEETTEETTEEVAEEATEETTEQITEEAPIARSVRLISDRDLNSLTEGDVVTLTVILEGFDNAQYTIDWQTAKSGDWQSIDGAHGTTYTFTADADCEGRSWQAAIEVIG